MRVLVAGGCGRMGQNHVRALHALGHTTITADPNGGDHRTASDALIAPAGIQAAVIATPVPHLAPSAKATLEHGIPTLIEKPMASSPAQAAVLAAYAARIGTPAQVGYIELHNPAVQALRRRLNATSDTPAQIHAIRQGPEPPHGGETLTDLGTHDLAVAAFLDPARQANRTILTGWAQTKTRILTVTTRNRRTYTVDYQKRTLDGEHIDGPDPLQAQLAAFLANPPSPLILHRHAATLAEAHGNPIPTRQHA